MDQLETKTFPRSVSPISIAFGVLLLILLAMCTYQEKTLFTLKEHLSAEASVNQNQGLVLQNVLFAACNGDQKCAQDFIVKSIQPK